jgi:hypothetical protein
MIAVSGVYTKAVIGYTDLGKDPDIEYSSNIKDYTPDINKSGMLAKEGYIVHKYT